MARPPDPPSGRRPTSSRAARPAAACADQPPAPLGNKRARTRAALVEAGLTLIARHGPEGVSVDDVVREAGVARGTFYNYFPAWHDLLVAVAQQMDDAYVCQVESRLTGESSPPAILACLVHGLLRVGLENPRLGWAWVRLGPRVPELLDKRAVEENSIKAVLSTLSAHISDEASFCVVGGTIFTAMRQLLEDRLDREGIDQVVTLLLRSLSVPEFAIGPALASGRAFAASMGVQSGNRPTPDCQGSLEP